MTSHPMRHGHLQAHTTVVGLAVLLILVAAVPAAGASAGYDLSWWTVDAGGATLSQGGGYTLRATAGQFDAASWSGGNYDLRGGFRVGGPGVHAYLPLTWRGA
jgi:hypothetical protein